MRITNFVVSFEDNDLKLDSFYLKMECEYCHNTYKNKNVVKSHQKRSKTCMNIRKQLGIELPETLYTCEFCRVKMASDNKYRHLQICKEKKNHIIKEAQVLNLETNKLLDSTKHELKTKTSENVFLNEQLNEARYRIHDLESRLDTLTIETIQAYQSNCITNAEREQRVKELEDKYLKKRSRIEYTEQNVIYLITTNRLRADGVYIMGKATNLTNRLSTYNKTDEHEVIYYQQCPDIDIMSVVENMLFSKLSMYREKANRERFVLPNDQSIDLFISAIKECIKFLTP